MGSNHPLLFIQQYFADSVHALILRHKTAGVSHRKFDNLISDIFCQRRFLRFTHSGNLRIGIDYARNSPITHGIFLSQDGMYGNFRFTNSRMGEQRESCQVTTNIHAQHRSLHLFINSDSATLCLLQIQVFEPETFRHRATADTHQQLFCNDTAVSLRVLIRNNSPFFRLRQADHFRTKQEFNTSFGIFRTEQSGKLLIHSTQDFVHHLNHYHLYSQTIEERRKLHTDYPATNNSQRSRQFFTVQSIPVRPVVHRVHSRNRRNKGLRPRT